MELLYLNLDTCDRCQGADRNLDAALEAVSRVLGEAGHEVTVRKTHVTTQEEAAALGFVSSPTIRVNGRDIAGAVAVHLRRVQLPRRHRSWLPDLGWQEQSHSSPPAGMIIDAILSSVYGPDTDTGAGPAPRGTGSVERFLAATRSARP